MVLWIRRIGLMALWFGITLVVLVGGGLLLRELAGSVFGAVVTALEGEQNAGSGLVWAAWLFGMMVVSVVLGIVALVMSRGLFNVGLANVALGVMLAVHSWQSMPFGVDVGRVEMMVGLAYVAMGLAGITSDAVAAATRRGRASS
jgi:hypothetical protein